MVDLISLSIVVPLFNERESLPDLLEQLYLAMQEKELRNLFTEPFCFEIIMVDDGSTDGSCPLIRNLILLNKHFRDWTFGKSPANGFIIV